MTPDGLKSPSGRDTNASDTNPKKLPPPCKRCLQKFSFKRSPLCTHYFCRDCYQNQQTYTGKDQEGNEIWQFDCMVCKEEERKEQEKQRAESENGETLESGVQRVSSEVALADPVEILGGNVKRVGYMELRAPTSKRPVCRPKDFVTSKNGELVLLNDNKHEVVVLQKDGQVRKKWTYMRSSKFQGGIAVSVGDAILLSLRNEKYSTVGYYSLDGKFLFSAFLDASARVPALCCTSSGDVVVLNSECDQLQFINQQKQITKSCTVLKEGELEFDVQGSSVATNSNDDIIICSPAHQLVRIFNSEGLFRHEFSISQIFTGREAYTCNTLPDSKPVTPLESARSSRPSPRFNSPRNNPARRSSLHTPVLPTTPEEPENDMQSGKTLDGHKANVLKVLGTKDKPSLNGSLTTLAEDSWEDYQRAHRLAMVVDSYDNLLIADRLYGTVFHFSSSGLLLDIPIQSVNENDHEKRWIVGLSAGGQSNTFSLVLERLYNGPELRTYTYNTARKFRSKQKNSDGEVKSKFCTILWTREYVHAVLRSLLIAGRVHGIYIFAFVTEILKIIHAYSIF